MAKSFDNLNKGAKNMTGFNQLITNAAQQKPKNSQTKDIIAKDVPLSVHKFLKIKATDESTTMEKLIIEAVVAHYNLEKIL